MERMRHLWQGWIRTSIGTGGTVQNAVRRSTEGGIPPACGRIANPFLPKYSLMPASNAKKRVHLFAIWKPVDVNYYAFSRELMDFPHGCGTNPELLAGRSAIAIN